MIYINVDGTILCCDVVFYILITSCLHNDNTVAVCHSGIIACNSLFYVMVFMCVVTVLFDDIPVFTLTLH